MARRFPTAEDIDLDKVRGLRLTQGETPHSPVEDGPLYNPDKPEPQ